MSISESEYILDSIKGLVEDSSYRHYENCIMPEPPRPNTRNHNIVQNNEGTVVFNFDLLVPDDIVINGVKIFEVNDISIYNIWENDEPSNTIFHYDYLHRINKGELVEDIYVSNTEIQNSNRGIKISKTFTGSEVQKVLNIPNKRCRFLIVLKSTDGLYSYTSTTTPKFTNIHKIYQIKIEFDGITTVISPSSPNTLNFNANPAKVIKNDRISRNNGYFSFDTIEIDEIYKNAFFIPKPCMVNEFGEVVSYLDQNDYRKTVNNSPSNIESISNKLNAMMEWSGVYWAVTYIDHPMHNGYYVFTICDSKIELTYAGVKIRLKPLAGNINKLYTAIFPGLIYESKLRSIGAKVNGKIISVNNTFDVFKSNAQKNKNVTNPQKPPKINFGIEDYETRLFINLAALMVFGDVSTLNKMYSTSVECSSSEWGNTEEYMEIKRINNYNFKLGLFKDNTPDNDNYINGYNVFGMMLWNPCALSYYLDGIIYIEKRYMSHEYKTIFKTIDANTCTADTSNNIDYINSNNNAKVYLNNIDQNVTRNGIVNLVNNGLSNTAVSNDLELTETIEGMLPKLPLNGHLSVGSIGSYCCIDTNTNLIETPSRMTYSKMYDSMIGSPTNRIFNLARVGARDGDYNLIGKNNFTGARLIGTSNF